MLGAVLATLILTTVAVAALGRLGVARQTVTASLRAVDRCRPAAAQAPIPALDQTRTVGLVTLPGAFVGVLLGGASPLQAGTIQLLVLIGLLAVETIAALTVVELVSVGAVTA